MPLDLCGGQAPNLSSSGRDGSVTSRAREPSPHEWKVPSAVEATSVPKVLNVTSPRTDQVFSGMYILLPQEQKLGQSVWERKDGGSWIFSGADGRWHIGGSQAMTANGAGSMISSVDPHRGRLPHLLEKAWQRKAWTGWQTDESIRVKPDRPSPTSSNASTTTPDDTSSHGHHSKPRVSCSVDILEQQQKPPAKILNVTVATGQTQCGGLYNLVPGMLPNGYPLWKHQQRTLWMFCSKSGRWCIGGEDVRKEGFLRVAGFLAQTTNSPDKQPHECSTLWQQWSGSQFEKDPCIVVTDCSPHVQSEEHQQPAAAQHPSSQLASAIRDSDKERAGQLLPPQRRVSVDVAMPSPHGGQPLRVVTPRHVSSPAKSPGLVERFFSAPKFTFWPVARSRSAGPKTAGGSSNPVFDLQESLDRTETSSCVSDTTSVVSDGLSHSGASSRLKVVVLWAMNVELQGMSKEERMWYGAAEIDSAYRVGSWLNPKIFFALTQAIDAPLNEPFFSIGWKPPQLFLTQISQHVQLLVDGEPVDSMCLLRQKAKVGIYSADGQRLMVVLRIVTPRMTRLPQTLRISSTSKLPVSGCIGDYDLVPATKANDQPIWAKRDGKRWLYSGMDGRWYVGGAQAKSMNFKCSTGHLCNLEYHRGRMPYTAQSGWAWARSGKWREDPETSVRKLNSCT